MTVVVLRFPGSNCDQDCLRAIQAVGGFTPNVTWHEHPLPEDAGLVIIPGGFSYGDYLRPGAIARFASVMADLRRFADRGGMVLGICNGFQILTEAGMLPGALLPNRGQHFVCRRVHLRVESTATPFTRLYPLKSVLTMPVAHGDGCYYADEAALDELERNAQVVFRYVDERGETIDEANPNGSLRAIAGISNRAGNVLGMMPHPERCCEAVLGGTDGVAMLRAALGTPVHALEVGA